MTLDEKKLWETKTEAMLIAARAGHRACVQQLEDFISDVSHPSLPDPYRRGLRDALAVLRGESTSKRIEELEAVFDLFDPFVEDDIGERVTVGRIVDMDD